MPTYDYVCRACGHELEIFHSISEPPRRKCPDCGKLRLERRIGKGAGILFKGGGFYQTDYRSEAYKRAESAEKTPSPEGAAAADKKAPEGTSDGGSRAASSDAKASRPRTPKESASKPKKVEKPDPGQ
jgi:putative FmdB family regulatory protein